MIAGGEFAEPSDWGPWDRLTSRLRIAHRIYRVHPTMPATAYWRIYEAEVVLRGLRGAGRGLDLGCGDGSFASVLFPAAPRIRWTGVDQDEVDAELARHSGQYEEVVLTRGEEMPFEDASFDVVFSNCVLEHIQGLDQVLDHVGRLLKPGGRFLFTVPSEDFYESLLIPRLLGAIGLNRLRRRYIEDLDRRLEIVNVLDAEEWRRRLAARGLVMRTDLPYLTRRAASLWELLATATGGLAFWLTGGRKPPRQILQSKGLARPDRAALGSLFFFLLSPLILLSAVQRNRPPYGGRFVEAIKEEAGG